MSDVTPVEPSQAVRGAGRRLGEMTETVTVSLTWLVVIVGVAVIALGAPLVTSTLVRTSGSAQLTGLPPAHTAELAEAARAFVVDLRAPELPGVVEGRKGFDRAAVDHLGDVRRVLAAARAATGLLSLVLAAWLLMGLQRGRRRALVFGLRGAGLASVMLPPVIALAGLADFETFFASFHGLFFDAGTWVFPSDSLLIQLFPERFWMIMGLMWGGLVVLGGAALLTAAAWISAAGRVRGSRDPQVV